MIDKKMKFYELTYLLSPGLSEGELRDLEEKIKSHIQAENGVISEIKNPVKRKLGYLIKDNSGVNRGEAYSRTFDFNLDSEKLESLEKKLQSESQILRHLILAKARPGISLLERKKLPARKPSPGEGVGIRPSIKVSIDRVKPKEKVELKEIEKKIEEILGE